MCTGIEKLRRAGDQLAIERNQERNELMRLRKELSLEYVQLTKI